MPRPQITRANPWTPTRGRFAGRTFHTEREYHNALAQAKGFRNWDEQRRHTIPTSSRSALDALRPASRAKRDQAFDVLALMRRYGLDDSAAVRAHNRTNPSERITREAVQRYVGSALAERNGKLVAKPYDRLLRVMWFPTERGLIPLEIRDSRSASRLATYDNAVKHFLLTGDERALRPFRGKAIRSGKRSYPFITDPQLLKRLQLADALHFDSIYEQFSAR
jgi:hypothetical protein